ncbi:MAG: DMT family transporter [Spirochaetota bacterium]
MQAILGQLVAIFIAMCWAQNSLVYSYVGKSVGSKTVAHIRLWIAIPMALVTHLIFTGTLFPIGLESAVYVNLFISGLLGFFIADLLIFQSYVDLGPRETLVILTTSPIFTAVISRLTVGEVLSILQVLGILVTIAGVILVIYSDRLAAVKQVSLKGLVIAFGGSITQAIAMVTARAGMTPEVHPVSGNLLRMIAGFIGLIIYASLRGEFFNDFRRMKRIKHIALISSAAFAGPVLGIALTLYAITLAPTGVITAITQISPILLLPIERFVFKRRITAISLAGTIIAIIGTTILVLA